MALLNIDRFRAILDSMTGLTIGALRVLIAVIGAGALFAQIRIVPFVATGLSEDAGHPAWGVPLAVAGILAITCGQVVLVALWALLSQVRHGSIFTPRAFRWVDAMVASGVVATALTIAVCVLVAAVIEPPLDAPGLVAISGGFVILSAAFVLLVLVMRGLLRVATEMRSELAEVV